MTFARYLGYRLKNVALRTALLAFLPLPFLIIEITQSTTPWTQTLLYPQKSLLLLLATILPMLEMVYFKKRRNLDVLYSFPIRRWKLGVAHYLCGLIQLVTIYTVRFVSGNLYFLTKADAKTTNLTLLYFGLSLVMGWIVYSYVIFFFSEANTVVDGIVFFILSSVMGTIFLLFLGTVWRPASGDHIPAWGLLSTPLNKLSSSFSSLLNLNRIYPYEYDIKELYYTIPWLILGILTTVAYFFNMAHKRFNKAEGLSNGIFGYSFLIPFCGLPLCFLFGPILGILPLSLMFIGYIVQRRSIKFKVFDYVMLGLGVACALISLRYLY